METDDVLLHICNKMGNFGIILKAAKYLYENESKSKNLCLIAVLFLKYLAAHSFSSQSDSFNTSSDGLSLIVEDVKNGIDKSETDLYVDGVNFCQQIIRKALLTATEEDTFAICEVLNWVNSCFYLTKKENPIQNEIYKTFYTPSYSLPSLNTLSAIKDYFEICASYTSKYT